MSHTEAKPDYTRIDDQPPLTSGEHQTGSELDRQQARGHTE